LSPRANPIKDAVRVSIPIATGIITDCVASAGDSAKPTGTAKITILVAGRWV
jgi:hypothetical protein